MHPIAADFIAHLAPCADPERADPMRAYMLNQFPFFIRKAIGWALRDYARHDPLAVTAFLRQERANLSALTVREAGKHLDIDRNT